MARSTCIKCEGHLFELAEHDPGGFAQHKYNLVQCSGCGTVVGAVDYYNLGTLIHQLAEKLGVPLDR